MDTASRVRELVEAHGGTVAVSSGLGEGATFAVRLPAASSGPQKEFTSPSQRSSTV